MAANPETVPTNEQRIIDTLRRAGGCLTKSELAHRASIRELLLPEYMKQLMRAGRAKMVGDSSYALPDWEPEVGCGGGARPAANVTPINPPRRRGRPPRAQAESKPAVELTTNEQQPLAMRLSIPPRQRIEGSFDAQRGVAVLTQGTARIEIHPDEFIALEVWLSALRTREI